VALALPMLPNNLIFKNFNLSAMKEMVFLPKKLIFAGASKIRFQCHQITKARAAEALQRAVAHK
jgi:hypothetical protein